MTGKYLPGLVLGPIRLEYPRAWDLQKRLQEARIQRIIPDVLLLVEHPPVITLGRSADPGNILWPTATLEAQGIEVVQVERGGDVTYHGPGQITGYPILDLESRGRDLGRFLRGLEEVMLRTLRDYGLEGERAEGMTGVWVGTDKIGAIGIKIRSWVSMHGFAFNVDPDLAHFGLIVPCGLVGRGVTSLARLLGPATKPTLRQVAELLQGHLAEVFELSFSAVTLADLEARVAEVSRVE